MGPNNEEEKSKVQALLSLLPETWSEQVNELRSIPDAKLYDQGSYIYYGELKDGRRQGKGLNRLNSGQTYLGDWVRDMKQGYGREIFRNGSTYVGGYNHGSAFGYGTLSSYTGEIYKGEWLKGYKHGKGEWKGSFGERYVGEWKQGRFEGFGVFEDQEGNRYIGNFLAGFKHGIGKQIQQNGKSFEGRFEQGMLVGPKNYIHCSGLKSNRTAFSADKTSAKNQPSRQESVAISSDQKTRNFNLRQQVSVDTPNKDFLPSITQKKRWRSSRASNLEEYDEFAQLDLRAEKLMKQIRLPNDNIPWIPSGNVRIIEKY